MSTETIKSKLCGPNDNEAIVFIEYDGNNIPFCVVTHQAFDHRNKPWFKPEGNYDGTGITKETYDFDWSEGHESLYYHNSGSGGEENDIVLGQLVNPEPPEKIWAAAGMRFVEQKHKGQEWVSTELTGEQIRARGYEVIKEPLDIASAIGESGEVIINPFDEACESETVYCSICEDRFPDDSLCKHVFWSEGGWYAGIGSDEGKIEDAKEDILFFASKIKKRILVDMVRALENNSFWLRFHGSILGPVDIELHGDGIYIFNILEGFNEDHLKTNEELSKMQEGGYWLVSLEEKKTKEANAMVAKWLRQEDFKKLKRGER